MVEQTAQSMVNCRVKFKIHSTIFLYPKEGQITTTSTGLPEIELVHDWEQDTIILDWESYQQTKGSKIL